jgi:hypothetical protein
LRKTASQAAKDLNQIADGLRDTDAIAKVYGEAVLREAVSRAQSRPTPQAPMAAEAMGMRGTEITVLTGGTPEAVSGGSEWGSDLYPQFGPRNQSGWWLMPSTESESAKQAGEAYLEDLMDDAVGRF